MTDRIDALREVHRLIDEGSWPGDLADVFGSHQRHYEAWLSYGGSLDAARALHEAVLPGWSWSLSMGAAHVSIHPDPNDFGTWVEITQRNSEPARAWLLAILSTLIAIEDQSQ